MERKTWFLALAIVAILLSSGCIGGETPVPGADTGGTCNLPKKMIGNVCCDDANGNTVCDIDDIGCPPSCDDGNACTNDSCSADTDFACVHAAVVPCCGNGVCDPSEDAANECSADCTVISISKFKLKGTPDFMEGNKFVFIHTGSAESEQRVFYLNLTAGSDGMENIRYTFKCNSTQHKSLDSINSEVYNLTDDDEDAYARINKLEDDYYLIYTNFFREKTATYGRELEELEGGEGASFHFSIQKKDPQLRDELSCLVKFYFMQPRKIVEKWLYISYI
ncbi:MAG: hypothetical protein V1813_02595 [Candidatus Aenigmatarchaeota archaeon]